MGAALKLDDVLGSKFTERDFELIQELVKSRINQNDELEYESFEGYELPPRTQFSMLKKPAVTIKYGKLTFNMACIKMFLGTKFVLPLVNSNKKRLAIVPCKEEESASVEWARVRKKDGEWCSKSITSIDFVEGLFSLLNWDRACRYKIIGRVAASERGLILVFDLEEAIMFGPKKEEYTDQITGEKKRRQVKYYPDAYKNRIGRSYSDYARERQLEGTENLENYGEQDESCAESNPIISAGSADVIIGKQNICEQLKIQLALGDGVNASGEGAAR